MPSRLQALRYKRQQDKRAHSFPGNFIFVGKTDKQIERQLYKVLLGHGVCYEGAEVGKKGGNWSGPCCAPSRVPVGISVCQSPSFCALEL